MSTPKFTVVPEELPPITDLEIGQQIIALLEDNRRLRHELRNKKFAYELAMTINHRCSSKIKDLEATIKMMELCNEAFTPAIKPKLKAA